MNANLDLTSRIVDFAEFLRANELTIDPGTVVDMQHLASIGYVESRLQLRRCIRSCTCRRPKDWQRFDALFDTFWQATEDALISDETASEQADEQRLTLAGQQRLLGLAGTSEKQRQEEEFFGAGDFKALSLADFRFVFNPVQMRAIEQLVERIARQARKRFTRRQISVSRGSTIDLRKSMKLSLRYGGQPIDLRYKRKRQRLHRYVLLMDISQSMDVYARIFLRFSRVLMTVFQRSDAFVFNTDLSELPRGHARLDEKDFEQVLNERGKGWLGGTRIAQSLERFNDEHLLRRVDNHTTVLIFSDGCDTTPPERLAAAVANIQRRSRKLVWVNPLLGRFEPGEANPYMDPVVPFTDSYCSAHNVSSLIDLERELLS